MDRQCDNRELHKLTDSLEEMIVAGTALPWEAVEAAMSQITAEKDRGLHGLVCYYAAYYMLHAGRIEEALGYLNESVGNLVGSGQEMQAMRCYNMLGIIAHGQDDLVLAMEYYNKALAYAERFGNHVVHGIVHGNMADAYLRVGNYERAVKCYTEGIQEYESYSGNTVNGDVNYCKILAGYGYCLVLLDELGQAAEAARKLDGLTRRLKDQTPWFAVYTFYTYLCYKYRQPDKSEEYLHKAMENMEGVTSMNCDNLLNILHFITQAGRYGDLKTVLDRAEPQAALEHNDGLLVQMLIYRLKYCCDNMPPEEYVKSTQTFFTVKEVYENNKNGQILRMAALRNRLREIEEHQEELKRKNSRLQYQAEYDVVSGLHNRRHLNRKMEECFDQALIQGISLGVVFMDIDYFKEMNDSYGHQRGDECIAAIAGVIQEGMQGDYVARYGGDEFVAITLGDTENELREKVLRVQEGVRKLQIPNEHSLCSRVLTITIGAVHAIPHKPNKIWDFMATADEVLYRQKRDRKDGIRISYQPGEY